MFTLVSPIALKCIVLVSVATTHTPSTLSDVPYDWALYFKVFSVYFRLLKAVHMEREMTEKMLLSLSW